MVQLRTYAFLDRIQSQLAAYMAGTAKGYLPVAGEASLWIEIAPGMAINKVTDIAQKNTSVRPGVQVVERAFGVLEVHAKEQDEVLEAGRQILSYLGLKEEDRILPKIITSDIITNIDPYQSMIINRTRRGNLLIEGQTLYILEVEPAAYVVLAANEAEKNSSISLIDIEPIGKYGRLYLSGTESIVKSGFEAIKEAMNSIKGN